MLCKCYWIVLYIVHFTAFCLGGGAFFPVTVYVGFSETAYFTASYKFTYG